MNLSQNGLAFALCYHRILSPTFQGTMRLQMLALLWMLKKKEESRRKVSRTYRKMKEQ
jgi:hypothetical protein